MSTERPKPVELENENMSRMPHMETTHYPEKNIGISLLRVKYPILIVYHEAIR